MIVTAAWADGPLGVRKAVLQDGVQTFSAANDSEGFCKIDSATCSEFKRRDDGNATDGYMRAACQPKNRGRCVCDAKVAYPVISGGAHAGALNDAFRRIAAGYRCNADTAVARLDYEITFNDRKATVSIVFTGTQRNHGDGGSCHSDVKAVTADLRTGRFIALDEVLDRTKEAAIRESMASYLKAEHLDRQAYDVDDLKRQVQDLGKRVAGGFWTRGFFIRQGQVFVDIDDYLLGCSAGPSFPVPIPSRYLTDRGAALLR